MTACHPPGGPASAWCWPSSPSAWPRRPAAPGRAGRPRRHPRCHRRTRRRRHHRCRWRPGHPRPPRPRRVIPGPGRVPAGRPPPRPPRRPPGRSAATTPAHTAGECPDASYIGHQVWSGGEWEACDTTGTETDGGYTEAQFNFSVALDLRAALRRDGATVVMTRTSNDGVGPCIEQRAEIINAAHANVAVDIHADGGPPSGRGFTILEPVGDGANDAVITSSQQFGSDLRRALLADVPAMPERTYNGSPGIMPRDDLAGLNLTSVPKVLIECGNMRNATDAQLLVSASFQQRVARAIEVAIISFLRAG